MPTETKNSHSDDGDGAEKREQSSNSGSSPDRNSSNGPSHSACVHCKTSKVRCQFQSGKDICERCRMGHYVCIPRSRKKRKPVPTHEDLQEEAYQQDLLIKAILLQIDEIKAKERLKWFAGRYGISFEVCDLLGDITPALGALPPPDIVKYCSLTPCDISRLFIIFFDRINTNFSILDPELHVADKLLWTSPFLFTVICAVASRHYPDRPDLYPLAMEFASDAARRALTEGLKGLDICQALLILGVYPVPKKRWAEDHRWLLMGVAMKMALELQLNQPPPANFDERERLNRARTWLTCYCVDGSHAIQFGKIPMLSFDDHLARNSRYWYKSSPSGFNLPYDVHLTAYVHIIGIVVSWRSTVTEIQGTVVPIGLDFVASALETQEQIAQEFVWWLDVYAAEFKRHPFPICAYRGNTTHLIACYLRLVVLSEGFQHAVKEDLSLWGSVLVSTAIKVAREVINIMVNSLYPMGFLRFALEANFLYVSFAAAFLINLLRPKFLPLLDESLQENIIRDVESLIRVLGSSDVAVDCRHAPALYSRFLSSLLGRHRVRCQGASQNPASLDQTGVFYTWPDVRRTIDYAVGTSQGSFAENQVDSDQVVAQHRVEMDLSLAHFVAVVDQSFLYYPASEPPAELAKQM